MHVLALVERGGDIRSVLIDHRSVGGYIRKHVAHESRFVTDGASTTSFRRLPSTKAWTIPSTNGRETTFIRTRCARCQSMPEKPKPVPKRDDPEQSKRFIEAAREIGADETERGAERAFKKIVQKPRKAS